jgi:hypothetical protein
VADDVAAGIGVQGLVRDMADCGGFLAAGEGYQKGTGCAAGRERGHVGVCIPAPGCRSLQKDEPLAEGTFLRPSEDWQGQSMTALFPEVQDESRRHIPCSETGLHLCNDFCGESPQ